MPPSSFDQITSILPDHAVLLRAAGTNDPSQLAGVNAEELRMKLEYAGWQSGLRHKVPSIETIRSWIVEADVLLHGNDAVALTNVREAVIVPRNPSSSSRNGAWVPPGLRAASDVSGSSRASVDMDAVHEQTAEAEARLWRAVDPAQFRSMEEYTESPAAVLEPLSETIPERSVPRIAAKPETQPSRWTVRGVVHPRGFAIWFGALLSVLWRVGFLASLVALCFFFTAEKPIDHTNEVLIGAAILTVLGLGQLWAIRLRCRVCSCHIFFSRRTIKNRKAHRIPLTGRVFSLALHVLIFRWFRCMYCGTAIRLSERRRDD